MSQQLGLSEVLCRVIVNRGITAKEDIDYYLNPNIDRLFNPREMKDMDKSIDIILSKIKDGKNIRIISDYDVDGIISCYILYTALTKSGAIVDYMIPHRVTDGYGINENIVRKAYDEGIDTIITCDNGTTAFEPIACAKELGMTVIITDHHEIAYTKDNEGQRIFEVPIADAILNPKQLDCSYPFKFLCGAGVVFKFVQALYSRLAYPMEEAQEFLQYLSIATVCDIVDLVGENRVIVKSGLEQLNSTTNKGLIALLKDNGLNNKKINAYTIGFVIGPCLNAAGRLDHAHKGLKLLLANCEEEADAYAKELYILNQERRVLTEEGYIDVLNQVKNSEIKEHKVKIIYNAELHESVIGIIAGRIKDKFNCPVIVLTSSEGSVKGSGRSIDKYHLYDELAYCKDLFEKFGGHAMAAGLSLKESNISLLVDRLNNNFKLTDDDLIPILSIDALLPIEEVTKELILDLQILEPFGKGNAKPIFGDKGLKINRGKYLGKNNNVFKLELVSKINTIHEGIIFYNTEEITDQLIDKWGNDEVEKMLLGQKNNIRIDIAYYPKINLFRGVESVQMQIQYIK